MDAKVTPQFEPRQPSSRVVREITCPLSISFRFRRHDRLILTVSVGVLANNALRAHYASAHGGVSTNGLPDICLIFLEMIILSCLK